MKLLIVGASRGTGAHAVRIALARGHQVTAFARTPEKLGIQDPKLTLFPGDFHDQGVVDRAVAGQDAVVVTIAPSALKEFKADPTYFSSGTARVIDAMKKHGVRRIVLLSAFGTGESRALANFFVDKVLISLPPQAPLRGP